MSDLGEASEFPIPTQGVVETIEREEKEKRRKKKQKDGGPPATTGPPAMTPSDTGVIPPPPPPELLGLAAQKESQPPMSPDHSPSTKKTEVFSVKEAGDEIKRLRRELRIHREELARRRVALEDMSRQIEKIRDESIPLKEARKITYKALRKGRALQYIAHLFTHSSVNFDLKRHSFNVLAKNAFGEGPFLYRNRPGGDGTRPGILKPYTDSQLMLLRQEQLVLMAENERLVNQVKNLETSFRAGEFPAIPGNYRSDGHGREAALARAPSLPQGKLGRGMSAQFAVGLKPSHSLNRMASEVNDEVELDIDLVTRLLGGIFWSLKLARMRAMLSGWTPLIKNRAYQNGMFQEAASAAGRVSNSFPLIQALKRVFAVRDVKLKAKGFRALCHHLDVKLAKENFAMSAATAPLSRSPTGVAPQSFYRHAPFASPAPMQYQPGPHGPGANLQYQASMNPAANLQYQVPGPQSTASHGYAHMPHYYNTLPSNTQPRSLFVPKDLPAPEQLIKQYTTTLPPEPPFFRPSNVSVRDTATVNPYSRAVGFTPGDREAAPPQMPRLRSATGHRQQPPPSAAVRDSHEGRASSVPAAM
eukprot:Selendium_serpulae@DN4920_c0_g1_i3.p1